MEEAVEVVEKAAEAMEGLVLAMKTPLFELLISLLSKLKFSYRYCYIQPSNT